MIGGFPDDPAPADQPIVWWTRQRAS
jgi:hypothetical protein